MKLFQPFVLTLLLVMSGRLSAVQIVTDSPNVACEEIQLFSELAVYQDPNIFLADLAQIDVDPRRGWESLLHKRPLLTTLPAGLAYVMRLADPREFRNFNAIARLYELANPAFKPRRQSLERRDDFRQRHTLVIPIKICGRASSVSDPYTDTLGIVIEEELKRVQQDPGEPGGGLPPSTRGNPIPVLP